MRTLLTYVLAALAATFAICCVRLIVDAIAGGIAGSIADFATAWIGYFGSILTLVAVVFSLAWFVSEVVVSNLSFGETKWSMIGRAVVVALILTVGVTIGRAGGFGAGLSEYLTGFHWFGAPQLIGAAVWGTVFWIRAPKPSTAGIAA